MKEKKPEMLSDEQLKELLRAELGKASMDGAKIREIMRTLRQRDDCPEIPEDAKREWQGFLEAPDKETELKKERRHNKTAWVWQAAAVAAMLCFIIFAVPMAFGAENIVQLIAVWTDETFRFLNPGETTVAPAEYVFETEHEGLQEIYDTVTALGVDFPVVPMWVPDGYELSEIKVAEVGENARVVATLYKGEQRIVFLLSVGERGKEHWKEKDAGNVEIREIERITHYIMGNRDELFATWSRDTVICYISVDMEKDRLIEILDSVYHKR